MNTNGGISYEMAYHMPIANNKGTTMSMEDLAKRKDFKPDFVTSKAAPKK